ncbi:MAG: RnfABCDGE type electron transport complex subunit B [Candidatus Wallbacteria bacterium]|nr:RnfABCDGE type electron transport complex subunit B [Candidatus Wallbacteria bacterium]
MHAALISLGSLGFLFGLILAVASYIFRVETDERIVRIAEALPGANCGGCGFPGCTGYAEAIVKKGASLSLCSPGGTPVLKSIETIMGASSGTVLKKVAFVRCRGGNSLTRKSFNYVGIHDCAAANLVACGDKSCSFGCLGYATCVASCPFGAMTMSQEGLPVVNPDLCTGCGKCLGSCPRGLIVLVPAEKKVHVACISKDNGPAVKKVCETGCIACRICEKVCPVDAISVKDNYASIDYEKCIECMLCVGKCPVKVIQGEPREKKIALIGNECIGCTICVKACPVAAISGERKAKHVVDKTKCIGCGLCISKCPKKAISLLKA